ncbi:MAG: serine protease [Lysobacteraceae bacterium]|nr:MAG: serine protease [Xanthomonadaceae bacterium]
MKAMRAIITAVGALVALGCLFAAPPVRASSDPAAASRRIVVAVADRPDPVARAGSTPRGYGGLPDYAGSSRARSLATALAEQHQLHEVSAWTIEALRLRCMLYELPEGLERDATLAALRRDPRVRLAQPLNEFETLGAGLPSRPEPLRSAHSAAYNDPYVGLQRGFDAIDAASAQRWAQGEGVEIAIIDTALDASHPDLRNRVVEQRDLAATAPRPDANDRHGTEVAGVIAAVANNELGIVGVAPAARLHAYRACWTVDASGKARCDSYTLALALGAAIDAGADIINLSLGGPSDLLLTELTTHALERGVRVVGAVPPDGRLDGFPVDIPGVIAVRAVGDSPAPSAITAPGRDILTLEPGGHYDFASGSSLAAAHVSGALALLLELRPRLDHAELLALLRGAQPGPEASFDVCRAVTAVRHDAACRAPVHAPLASSASP